MSPSTSTCPDVPVPQPSCGECPSEPTACQGGMCPVNLANGGVEQGLSFLQTPQGSFDLNWYNLYESAGSPADPNRGAGTNWTSPQFAYVAETPDGTKAIVRSPGRNGAGGTFGGTQYFHLTDADTYESCYGCFATLTDDGGDLRLTQPDGSVTVFDGTNEIVKQTISPGGQVTDFTYNSGIDRITEMRRTVTSGGQTSVESREFQYYSGGAADGLLRYATLRREDADPPVAWTDLRRLEFVYYESDESGKGNTGDWKLIKEQRLSGMTWVTDKTTYFRYYTANASPGYKHGLKMIVPPAGYAAFGTPESESDGTLKPYSSVYYEYSTSTRQVTKAATEGGAKEFTISYTDNSGLSSYSYNHWLRKAEMTNPDTSTRTVYSNHIGQDMLVDIASGGDHWIYYTEYNDDGRPTERAQPSAIDMSGTPYDDSFDDLDVQLKSSDGLIDRTTYYTTTGSGAAKGRPEYAQVRKGASGSIVNLSKLEYEERKINSGTATEAAVYPVKNRIVYRTDSGGGDPVTTEYAYTWHSGTVQPQTITTKLPNVPSGENGVSYPQNNQIVQELDVQGRLVSLTDARGMVTEYEYDSLTGAMTQMTQDVGGGKLNLVTDYSVDELGRRTETLGPAHDVDGYTIRTASWTVYQDGDDEVWTGSGYVQGGNSTLVNPVSIQKFDKNGRPTDSIQAKRGSTVESSGKLTESDTFAQTSWVRWTHQELDGGGRLTSTRVYFSIPSSGAGSVGTNYDETQFGYDASGRRNMQKTPAGTITRTVHDARGNVLSMWVGTDDTGATASNPAGSGAPNNMKMVTENEYDGGADGGDGNVTQITQPVDANSANDRVTEYQYDWRDRRIVTITDDGTYLVRDVYSLDNLDRVTVVEQKRDDSGSLTLINKSETKYDARGRVYRTLRYAVASGTPGNSLADNTWFDANDNAIKSQPAGSQSFTKTTYDALNRATAVYSGYYSGGGTDDPTSLTDNVVFEESHSTFDAASNATFVISKARFDNASGSGALAGPSGSPASRDSYMAYWYDGIGRQTETANYGTNGGSAPTRPSTPPSSSATVLVSLAAYNINGELEDQTDPAGKVTRTEFDDAGRTTKVTRNYGSSPTEVTRTEYDDGLMVKLIAENSTTGNQETVYEYGPSGSPPAVFSNQLLKKVTYPGDGDPHDRATNYEYNRQSERTTVAAPGSTHTYEYDKLGRPTKDTSNLIAAIRRIERTYDNRRRLEHVTSYDAATGGNVVNDVQFAYNEFGQVAAEYQEHAGAVNTSTSLKVQYAYTDGGANTTRRMKITYPNGREVHFTYGSCAHSQKLVR